MLPVVSMPGPYSSWVAASGIVITATLAASVVYIITHQLDMTQEHAMITQQAVISGSVSYRGCVG